MNREFSLPLNSLDEEFLEEPDVQAGELLNVGTGPEEGAAEDAVHHYLKDAGQMQLLTVAEERRLGALLENGRLLEKLQSVHREKYGREATALDIACDTLRAIQEGLWLLAGAAESDKLLAESANTVEPQLGELAERLSQVKGVPPEQAKNTLINYSIAKRITPKKLLEVLNEQSLKLAQFPSQEQIEVAISSSQEQLEAHFEDVQHEAKRAEERLVVSNLRLVISIARKYIGQGLPLLDLVQEGNTGLMRAVQKFDYRKGYKFSTYATLWIRQSVTRALADQQHTIRIPVYMVGSIRQYLEARQRLYQEHRRKPTTQEIAQEMGIPLVKAEDIKKALSQQLPASLEQSLGDEEGELGDLVPSQTPTPEDIMAESWMQDQVHRVLESLTPRERRILELRFGMRDGRPRTLDEVGVEFHLGKERIRQIQMDALRKLRRPLCQLAGKAN